MDVEKTIEVLLKNQARMDARFEARFDRAEERFRRLEEPFEERFRKSDLRMDRLERVVALNNRIVTRLVRYGVSLRSDVRRLTQAQAETDRALKTFIKSLTHHNGTRWNRAGGSR